MNRDFPKGAWSIPIELGHEPDFRLGGLTVQPSLCKFLLGGESRSVEPRVMQVLVALAQRKNLAVTRDQLVQRCWGGRIVSEDAINRALAKVRRLAELDGGRSFRVETVPKIGFRLVESDKTAKTDSNLPSVTNSENAPPPAIPSSSKSTWRHWGFGVAIIAICLVVAAGIALWTRGFGATPLAAIDDVPAPAPAVPTGVVVHDCAIGCPQMVVIPPGYFMMGAARSNIGDSVAYALDGNGQDESPRHEVVIRRPFAIGRYDVTRAEYAVFVKETNRPKSASCFTLTRAGLNVETLGGSWQRPGFRQSDRDPVVCVNWDDAVTYTRWLSRRTGKSYRLPTEAEWEYSARAGSMTDRPGDGSPGSDCRFFNGADEAYHRAVPGDPLFESSCHDGYAYTSPVGTFPANAFGLFDMEGNVVQWLADCYHPSYDGAPVDGSAWTDSRCSAHVARGGGWQADSRDIRFTRRGEGATDSHWSVNGFRVARNL